MNAELLAKYDRPVPRYTSYPTAPHFHAGDRSATTTAAGSPSCRPTPGSPSTCTCRSARSCAGIAAATPRWRGATSRSPNIRACCCAELDLVGAALGGRRPVGHIHFGGGTPTMLAPDDLRALGERLRAAVRVLDAAEFAVEIDPRRLTRETVDCARGDRRQPREPRRAGRQSGGAAGDQPLAAVRGRGARGATGCARPASAASISI